MLYKIFLFILLITSIYTYVLKSIENNNDTNFQKLPDNFNFESNKTQTVNLNLKPNNMHVVKTYLSLIFGHEFTPEINGQLNDSEHLEELFSKDFKSKIKECDTKDKQNKIFENDMVPVLEKSFESAKQEKLKEGFYMHTEKFELFNQVNICFGS